MHNAGTTIKQDDQIVDLTSVHESHTRQVQMDFGTLKTSFGLLTYRIPCGTLLLCNSNHNVNYYTYKLTCH